MKNYTEFKINQESLNSFTEDFYTLKSSVEILLRDLIDDQNDPETKDNIELLVNTQNMLKNYAKELEKMFYQWKIIKKFIYFNYDTDKFITIADFRQLNELLFKNGYSYIGLCDDTAL